MKKMNYYLTAIALCCIFFVGQAKAQSEFTYGGYRWGMTSDQVKNITPYTPRIDNKDMLIYMGGIEKLNFYFKNNRLYMMSYNYMILKDQKKVIEYYNNKKIDLISLFGNSKSEKPGVEKKDLPTLSWEKDSTSIELKHQKSADLVEISFYDYHNPQIALRPNYPVKNSSVEQSNKAQATNSPMGNLTIFSTSKNFLLIQIKPVINGLVSIYDDGHFVSLNKTTSDIQNCMPVNDSYDGTNGNNNIAIAPNELKGIKGLGAGPFAGHNWNNGKNNLLLQDYLSINLPYGEYEIIVVNQYDNLSDRGKLRKVIGKDCNVLNLNGN